MQALKTKRAILIFLGSAVLVLVGLGVGLHFFLRSSRVAEQVTARLEAIYGGHIHFDDLDIGLTSVIFHGIELYEVNGESNEPWLTAADLTADISLWRLIRGDPMPTRLRIQHAEVVVRFDAAGKLLTQVPTPPPRPGSTPIDLPDVAVKDSELVLRKKQAGEIRVTNIDMRLDNRDRQFVLTGSAQNAELGTLDMDGTFEQDSNQAKFHVKNMTIGHVTQATLDRLPFVSPAVWREIQVAKADTRAEMSVTFDIGTKAFHYRIELKPGNATLTIPRLGLKADHGAGILTIVDDQLRLRDGTGQAFDGAFTIDGNLDFSGAIKVNVRRFQIKDMDLDALPENWNIPPIVRRAMTNGRLDGTASLEITQSTPGDGDWHIKSAGHGEVRDPAGKSEPIQFDWTLTPSDAQRVGWIESARPTGPRERWGSRTRPTLLPELISALLAPNLTIITEDDPPDSDLKFNLKNVDLAEALRNQGVKLPFPVEGKISLQAKASLPTDKIRDAKAYRAVGAAQFTQLKVAGVTLDEVEADFAYAEGVLTLKSLKSAATTGKAVATTSLQGSGRMQLIPLGEVRADLKLTSIPLSKLPNVPTEQVRGNLSGQVTLGGSAADFPKALQAQADFAGERLAAFGLTVDQLRLSASLKAGVVELKEFNAHLYDGAASGSAVIPLDSTAAGRADFSVKGLDLGRAARDAQIPIPVEGHVSGALTGTLPAVKSGQERIVRAHLEITAPLLRVQHIPTEKLHGVVEYRQNVIDYKLTGDTLGGTFDLEGQMPTSLKPQANAEPPKRGHLTVKNIEIGRLLRALRPSADRAVSGRVAIDVQFTQAAFDRWPDGTGRLLVNGVRYGDDLLIDQLQGDIELANEQLRLRNVVGDLAQGIVGAEVLYFLRQPERSRLSVDLERVESGQLLRPWLEHKISGPVSARIRGRFGNGWHGEADLELARGQVLGMSVTELRVPVLWAFAPGQERGEIQVNDTSVQLAQGSARGKLSLSWDRRARVEGSIVLDSVNLQELLSPTVGATQLVGGRASAKITFKGTEVQSLNDISATITASFKQAQALQLPVLSQIAPFLGVGPSTTFQYGSLSARRDGGTLRIEQLTLQGTNVQVYMDGTISAENRLDLHVVAKTGNMGWPTLQLGPIGVRAPIVGPLPLTLVAEVSSLLANHVIYLDVTGSAKSPTIQPRPLPILSQEAVRFFLNRSNLPITFNP